MANYLTLSRATFDAKVLNISVFHSDHVLEFVWPPRAV